MSLLSWLFPRRAEVEDNKNALKEAWRNEIIISMLQAGMTPRRANPNRENKYELFYSKTIVSYRKRKE